MAKDKRPNLNVSVKVQTTSGGEFELKPTATSARNRVRGLNWRTKLGEGFSDGGGTLPRRVDQDHPDIGLMDLWTVVDDDGDTLYQGRLAANPRTLDESHSIGVTLVGLMADAKRRKFAQVYVDRNVGSFAESPISRKSALLLAGDSLGDFSFSNEGGALVVALPNQALGAFTLAEVQDALPTGVTATSVQYVSSVTSPPASWLIRLLASDTPDHASPELYTFVNDTTLRTITLSPARRYLSVQVFSNGSAVTPAAGANWRAPALAVYGDSGLTTYAPLTSGQPNGVRATDALKHIVDTYCPGISSDGIQDGSYVIPHLTFADRTYPYDAFLQINKYLLWKLACWEDGRIVFEPHDLTDYTWQIRTDDPNVSIEFQGPSTETIYNGVAVTYTDLLTGAVNTITPDTNPELADEDPENPFNKASIPQWLEVPLSTPQLVDDAVQIGIAELAEANRPKAPGSFTVQGHIRDRAGNWQHVGKVRSGETIAITNHPNDDPRLIVETDYQDDNKTVRIATDLPFNLLEAMMDRVDVELQAGGLRT